MAGCIRFNRVNFLILFWLALLTGPLAAQDNQPYLHLGKTGSGLDVYYFEGEEIRFRLVGEKHFRKDHILGLSENTIRFHYYTINLADIDAVDIRGRKTGGRVVRSLSGKLIFAGVALIGIDQLNQVVIRDEPAGISKGIAIASGVLAGTGLIIALTQRKYFKPGSKRFIQIVDPRDQVFRSE